MTEIVNETNIVSEHSNSAIDDFFKGYDKPLTIDEPVRTITEPVHRDTITPDNINQEQEYYVRGPKKGQPKPKGNKVVSKVSYTTPPNQELPNELFTGELFLTLIDVLFPMLIAAANNMISKKNKVNADDLGLTDKQKRQLESIADKVAKGINIEANPVAALGVMLAAIYSTNLIALRSK